MRTFFRDIGEGPLMWISQNDPESLICGFNDINWLGVTSTKGVIHQISYERMITNGPMKLDYLPQTVIDLEIVHCEQTIPSINTRMLPREAIQIQLSGNRIGGGLDLSALPRNLWFFAMNRNVLTGPIHFVGLPPDIQSFAFAKNKIEQRVMYYDDLPEALHTVSLEGAGRIGVIKPLYPRREKRKAPFQGITKDRVRS